MVLEDLRHTGFGDPRIMDMAYQQEYWIPSNLILPNKHQDSTGRGIVRLGPQGGMQNSEQISPTIGRDIEKLFQSSERRIHAAILHSRDPEIALQAAKNAKNNGSLISLDYSESEPKIVNNPAMRELLSLGDYLFVDSDAVLPGMDRKNPDDLFVRLRDEYQKRFFALSNSSKAIRAYADGQDVTLPVRRVDALDPNGAGDVRTAATTLFLLKGQSFLDALKQCSNFASHSVAHYGREWAATLEHVHKDLLIKPNENLNGHNGTHHSDLLTATL
jgi:sugar/nucleoside kinase (ribokinase family)